MRVSATRKREVKSAVVEEYVVTADSKRRISLRGSKTKYFKVIAFSDGKFVLEPQVLVSRKDIAPRVLKVLNQSAENLKKGLASAPIDLTPFRDL